MPLLFLGDLRLFARGFHLSPLHHGLIARGALLSSTLEEDNASDDNAVRLADADNVCVGHIPKNNPDAFNTAFANAPQSVLM